MTDFSLGLLETAYTFETKGTLGLEARRKVIFPAATMHRCRVYYTHGTLGMLIMANTTRGCERTDSTGT